jgi:tRNA-dihydrouridine synthase 1
MSAHASSSDASPTPQDESRPKLHGRAFYESIGSPKIILAPMVEQSEFVFSSLLVPRPS